jgi:hypothetical protein
MFNGLALIWQLQAQVLFLPNDQEEKLGRLLNAVGHQYATVSAHQQESSAEAMEILSFAQSITHSFLRAPALHLHQ